MDYPFWKPPFKVESFRDMPKMRAQQFFNWYIADIPNRVKLLEHWFSDKWGYHLEFNYSLESLDPLWQAFEERIEIYERTEQEIRQMNAGLPEYALESALEDPRAPTMQSLMMAFDIGAYFGETLGRNLPAIHWGFVTRPRLLHAVNEPVILGFKHNMNLDPRNTMQVGCFKFIERGPMPRFLSELVDVWREFLPDE